MATIIRFPSPRKPDDPAAALLKTAATAAVNSGLPRRDAAQQLIRVAEAMLRREA